MVLSNLMKFMQIFIESSMDEIQNSKIKQENKEKTDISSDYTQNILFNI